MRQAVASHRIEPHRIEPLAPERYRVQLTANAGLKNKLELARDLLRHALPSGDLAAIVERALDLLIEQTMKRRFAVSSRTAKAAASEKAPRAPRAAPATPAEASVAGPRRLPNDVRRAVCAREGARCSWRSVDGRRCDGRAWLELDHITPFGKGGSNASANIRLLCREHNRLAAELAYGREHVSRAVERQRESHRRAQHPRG